MLLMLPMLIWIPPVSAQPEEPTWQMYRPKLDPHDSLHIDETVHNANTNDEASVGIGVHVWDYVEDWSWDPYNGRDGVCFRVALTANTRKGITYDCGGPYTYVEWINAVEPVPGVTGDNSGAWLDITLPYGVRFYGGPGYECHSAEYNEVWVCSNGFLSFDSEFADPPNIDEFPEPNEPNSLLAVHWADLLIDDQAEVTYYGDSDKFVVCWKNVLNENNGKRQTFEVIIENDRLFPRGQNLIKFLYKDVTWEDSGAIVCIEDQEGYKGTFGSYASNGEKLEFRSYKNSAEIKRLKIKIEKSDPNALIDIDEDPDRLRGINVMLDNDNLDENLLYEGAVNDALTLLMSSAIAVLLGSNAAGIIVEVSFITLEAVASYAKEFSPFKREEADIEDAGTNDTEAHVYVKAEGDLGWPVDAAVGAQVHWVFTDDNNEDHSIRITAELEYTYYDTNGVSYNGEISTSVNLKMEIGHALTISAGSGGTTDPPPGSYVYHKGTSVTVTASAYSGYTFDYWLLDGATVYGNPITVTMDADHTLKACFHYSGGGGGGGCPILYIYDGTEYFCEGLLDIHNPEGVDVIYDYSLVSTPQRVHGAYLMRLTEHPKTHSYIDQVKLYAILEDGIAIELPLIRAWHSEDGNVLPMLLYSDEWKADSLGADRNDGTSQSIDLKFAALSPNLEIRGFIFQIEGNNPEFKP